MRTFLTIVALAAGMLVPPSAVAEPACTEAQDSAPAAIEMAKRCGKRVEITTLRSENSQTFAKPVGGYTTERSVEPRWARKPDGTWAAIDTTLRSANGVVAPQASALPVEFSAGGTGPAARLRDGDRELAITWPLGALPKPTLSGSDATYPEVLPGVDLKLTASALGFSEILIVKTREAAKNTKLATVKFGFTTKNVAAATTGTGGVEAKDAQGKVVFSSPTPLMWDSTPASAAGSMSVQSTTTPTRPVAMPVSVTSSELSVTPDAAMMADAATQFPIYIDPSWTGRLWNSGWTLVTSKSGMANTAFWQGGGFLQNAGNQGNAGTGLVCDNPDIYGNCGSSPLYNVRSYFQLDLTGVKGKVINGASLRIQQQWAWTCNGGGSDAVVRVSGNISGATTWNNQPNWWGDGYWASAPANHKYGASNGCLGTGDVEFNVTDMVRHGATDQWDALTVVLHVWNEGTVNQWKRFNASTPVLAIDYNTPPGQPADLTADAKACATGANRPFVPTATPTLRARVSDPDGDSLTARFEWARLREDGTYTPVAETRDQTSVSSGAEGQVTLPSGVLDHSETIVGTGKWDNDSYPDVIARDSGGYLYLFPGDGTKLGNRILIGTGWNGVTIAGVADWDGDGKRDILARIDSSGELYVYPGEGTRAPSNQQRALIGTGFGTYAFAGVADFDKDGKSDLIARDGAGTLWLYPGENKRSPSSQARAQIGAGFGAYTFHGVIDRTGDGAPDIVAEYGDTLWLYLGSGTRAPYGGTPYRYDIGSGWTGAVGLMTPDFNGDGAVDMVAQRPGQANWLLYPGVVGTGYGGNPSTVASVGLTEGTYAYRATAGDWQPLWGLTSGWCEFTVDVTAPAAPIVSATVYKSPDCIQTACGSLGVADTFTFSSTATDVVKYRWGFTDPPSMTVPAGTPVRWTPPTTGFKTLYVEAVDRAGISSSRISYQFNVASPTLPVGQWMNDYDPSADTSGNGHDLALNAAEPGYPSRVLGGLPAVDFNGSTASRATTTKVLDTGRGFSVSAWVRLSGDTVDRTVVSQQGSITSAFRLGYNAAQRRWVFALAESDVTNAAQRSAVSDAQVTPGVWTHLTGTYETANREVRLYVDGALQQAVGVVTSGFDAAGELWVGGRWHNGATVEPWLGQVIDVSAWNRAITPEEVAALVPAAEVGAWKFNENQGSTAHDSGQFAHDLTLTLAQGASWGQGLNGTGSGLHLNGTGSANSSEAVLNTDQSFTIDVWALLAEAGAQRTIVVQRGPSGVDPFALKYDGTKWVAEMPNASENPTTWWRVSSTAAAPVNDWTRLTVTYDAAARTLRLWTDGVLQGTATGVVGWNSSGVLSVGRGSAGAYWYGDIDELKVFQGLLAPTTLNAAPRTGASVSGDAKSEIISVDADGSVRAFLNVDGTYPNPAQTIGAGWTAERTWFADIDGDGKTEIITLDPDSTIRAFKNLNGMNGFPFGGAVTIGKATSTDPSRLRFADVDGDGRADRVSIDADGRVRVYRNLFGLNGLGQSTAFASSPVEVKVTAATPDRIRLADIDGDHRAEFITINDDKTVYGYRNTAGLGYGTYDSYQEIGSGWTADRTRFGDINGDGRAEIIGLLADGTVWSYPNLNGLNGFPYGDGVQIGSGWNEPARVFFG
ncbi:FG-GAP-like repeat-containing protein [Lentzea sp. NBRC 105346]|uniref:LamG-like jellyroll fold domain-containing protein n=1 Tax=Lentzea sp. NBRC 105346 TaxID=3032205 RepID=UPI0025535999|nr:FG-GAP-like repeat-containing protein [Lentzea sp. NBRC 105346]